LRPLPTLFSFRYRGVRFYQIQRTASFALYLYLAIANKPLAEKLAAGTAVFRIESGAHGALDVVMEEYFTVT
jgi:hypothetical protein